MQPRQNIWEVEWDYLIILDACRYDYFEKYYKDYFDGELKKVQSFDKKDKRTLTVDWLVKNFPKKYEDIVYVSSTPAVSKKPFVTKDFTTFSGKEHFFDVVEAWNIRWNNELGTVLPEDINELVIRSLAFYKNKKMVIDYSQPHFPYVGGRFRNIKLPKKSQDAQRKMILNRGKNKYSLKQKVRTFVAEYVRKNWGEVYLYKVMRYLKVEPKSSWALLFTLEGINGVREAYEENLKYVFENVRELIKHLDGRIIITADHGEYLGERGYHGHGRKSPHGNEIIEVPWLEVSEVRT